MLNNNDLMLRAQSEITYHIYTDGNYLHIQLAYEKPFSEEIRIPIEDASLVTFTILQVMFAHINKAFNKTEIIKRAIKDLENMV